MDNCCYRRCRVLAFSLAFPSAWNESHVESETMTAATVGDFNGWRSLTFLSATFSSLVFAFWYFRRMLSFRWLLFSSLFFGREKKKSLWKRKPCFSWPMDGHSMAHSHQLRPSAGAWLLLYLVWNCQSPVFSFDRVQDHLRGLAAELFYTQQPFSSHIYSNPSIMQTLSKIQSNLLPSEVEELVEFT